MTELLEAHSDCDRAARDSRTKDEFLATLAHELRNPLGAITAAGQVLKMTHADGAAATRAHDVIARQVGHITQLIDDLLDIERVVSGKIRLNRHPLDLADIVCRAVATFADDVRLARHIDVSTEPAWVDGDAVRIEQVLTNIVGNAVKYTPAGGIAVRARLVGVGGPPADPRPNAGRRATPDDPVLAARSPDTRRAWIALQVIDTGVGIAPGDQERIFDEFEQVNAGPRGESMQRGTGLGLAISRRLARLLGGEIAVESQLSKGSTFTVWLPVHPTDLDPTPTLTTAVTPADKTSILPESGSELRK
jgi:signal transduction histidine kinase